MYFEILETIDFLIKNSSRILTLNNYYISPQRAYHYIRIRDEENFLQKDLIPISEDNNFNLFLKALFSNNEYQPWVLKN